MVAKGRVGLLRVVLPLSAGALVLVVLLLGYSQWERNATVLSSRLAGDMPQGQYEDYVVFYSAGKLVLEGRGSALYDIEAMREVETRVMGRPVGAPSQGVLAYFNPPFVAAFFAPLAVLPLAAADLAIFVLVIASVLAAGWLTLRLVEPGSHQFHATFWLLFLTLGSVTWLVIQGQLTMLVMIGLSGYIYAEFKGRERTSGVLLALVLVKPHFAIFPVLYMLANRRWNGLKVFSALCGLLAAVSIGVSGFGILYTYPAFLLESATWESEAGVNLANMYGWSGFLARTLGSTGGLHYLLTATLSIVTLAILVVAALVTRTRTLDERRLAFAIGIVGTLMVSAHFYLQDAALLALAVALGYSFARAKGQLPHLWGFAAIVIWFAQAYARHFLMNHDANILTPAILGLFALSTWQYLSSFRVPKERVRVLRPSTGAAGQVRPTSL